MSVDGCLISHGHGDHCKAVPQLVARGIPCYASAQSWEKMKVSGSAFRMKGLKANVAEKVGPWTVTPFEVIHDEEGTLGFVVDSSEGDRFLYLTDSAYSKYTFPGLTHIAVECNFSSGLLRDRAVAGDLAMTRAKRTIVTHMSLERLVDMLKANDLSNVEAIWLMHLSDENSDEEAFREAVIRETGKPVYVCAKRGGIR